VDIGRAGRRRDRAVRPLLEEEAIKELLHNIKRCLRALSDRLKIRMEPLGDILWVIERESKMVCDAGSAIVHCDESTSFSEA
jgi:hypothetical protein